MTADRDPKCEKCGKPSGPLPTGTVKDGPGTAGRLLCNACWFATPPAGRTDTQRR